MVSFVLYVLSLHTHPLALGVAPQLSNPLVFSRLLITSLHLRVFGIPPFQNSYQFLVSLTILLEMSSCPAVETMLFP